MKPSSFIYHAPKTVEDAVALLARYAPEDGRVIAGGQSLIPIMNFRLSAPEHLVDINGIDTLRHVREENGSLVVPACVRHAAFEEHVTRGPLGALLAQVAANIAHRPIRTRGTFCGSLAHADPSSEWCLTAVTLGATLTVRSAKRERRVPADAFVTGVMSTALKPDELLVDARIPLLPEGTRFGFNEVSRRAGDFAMAACLVVYRLDGSKIAEARVGVGGAELRPRRIREAEAALVGRAPHSEAFVAAAGIAAASLKDVLEDARSTAEFRRDLVRAVVRRALERSL